MSALSRFVSVMTDGRINLGGDGGTKPKKPEIESRSYVRDLSPDIKDELKVNPKAAKEVQDWWNSILGHLPRCEIAVNIQASTKTWAKIDKNVILENKFGMLAHELVQDGIGPLSQQVLVILLRADAMLPPVSDAPDDKTIANINQYWANCQDEITTAIGAFQQTIAGKVEAEIKKTFADLKETKEEVQKYRIVAVARVVKSTALIAGNIAHAAASWGATSPLAIVSICREAIEIAQIVGKGLADAEDLGQLVEFDLAAIKKVYSEEPDSKAQNNTVESISGAISGILNIEIPNVKNCGIHIKDFDHKVRLLDIDYIDLGKKLVKLQEKIVKLEGKIALAKQMTGKQRIHKRLSNDEAIEKFEKLIKSAGAAHTVLFNSVPGTKEMVELYQSQSQEWKDTLAKFEKETSGWTRWVSTIASIATEAGLGMGHVAGEHVEGAAEIASQHLKEGIEASTIFMSGLLDQLLEKLSD